MKNLIVLCLVALAAAAQAQVGSRVFRCGNTYTNDAAEAQARGCKPLEGGNVTVVEGTRVQAGAIRLPQAPTTSATPRVDALEQRSRDADARYILEGELKKALARQEELQKEYNHGEPEKLGPETRNHQKYLDRVAELKAAIARNEADIAGLRRELSRLTASK